MSVVTLTSTGLAILVLQGGDVTQHDDGPDGARYAVVRTPDNPTYWWGNFIQVLSPTAAHPVEWLAVFDRHFPTARHVAIGLPDAPDMERWRAAGEQAARPVHLEGDPEDILGLAPQGGAVKLPAPTPLPTGYVVRRLAGDADFAALRDDLLADNARTHAHPHHEHERFVTASVAGQRALTEAGDAAWFGAFDDAGRLCSHLGIVDVGTADDGAHLARYQTVMTHPDHRRQGIAAHLVRHAAQWAAGRGADTFIIHADAESDAGRLYRRLGFSLAAQDHGLQGARR